MMRAEFSSFFLTGFGNNDGPKGFGRLKFAKTELWPHPEKSLVYVQLTSLKIMHVYWSRASNQNQG